MVQDSLRGYTALVLCNGKTNYMSIVEWQSLFHNDKYITLCEKVYSTKYYVGLIVKKD